MLRRLLRSSLLAATVLAGSALTSSGEAHAQMPADPRVWCAYRTYGTPDLFYNYYVSPNCTGLGAELYVAPLPVPPHVGHTYYTYQPFLPHEYMYPHHRYYHRYYDGGRGLNRTHVSWHHSPVHVTKESIMHFVRLPR